MNTDRPNVVTRDLDFKDALDAAMVGASVQQPDEGFPFVVLPDGATVHDLTGLLPERVQARLRGDVVSGGVAVQDVDSFIRYVARFQTPGTALFGNRDGARVTAALDYHSAADAPGEGAHSVALQLAHSRQWKAWSGIDRKEIAQTNFGEFLEDNLPDITEPDGAAVLEAARNLVLHKSVTYKGRVQVADGSMHFNYAEEVSQGATQSGRLEVPERLALMIPIYEHGAPVAITVRLRYRLRENDLRFMAILDRAQDARDAAFAEILAQIETGTGFKPYLGSAG